MAEHEYTYSPPGEEAPVEQYNFDVTDGAIYPPGTPAPIDNPEFNGVTEVPPDPLQENAAVEGYIDERLGQVEAPPIGSVTPESESELPSNAFGRFVPDERTRPLGELPDTALDPFQRELRRQWDEGNRTGLTWEWTDPDIQAQFTAALGGRNPDGSYGNVEKPSDPQALANLINQYGMNTGGPRNEVLDALATTGQANTISDLDAKRAYLADRGMPGVEKLSPEQIEKALATTGGAQRPPRGSVAGGSPRPGSGQEDAFKGLQEALVKSNQLRQRQELMDLFMRLGTGPGGPQNRRLAMALLAQIAPELAGQIAGGNITTNPAVASYTTVNGPKTLAQMESELRAAGWLGPTAGDDVVTAYKRTTGGDVTPITGAQPGEAGGMNPIGIPPATWDALPAAGKKLLLDAWEYQGGDRTAFGEAVNAQRPSGRASAPATVTTRPLAAATR